MEPTRDNIETTKTLANSLRERRGTFEQFDGVIFELIEMGILEAEAGRFARVIWDEKEVLECEDCLRWSEDIKQREDNGFSLCPECYKLED